MNTSDVAEANDCISRDEVYERIRDIVAKNSGVEDIRLTDELRSEKLNYENASLIGLAQAIVESSPFKEISGFNLARNEFFNIDTVGGVARRVWSKIPAEEQCPI